MKSGQTQLLTDWVSSPLPNGATRNPPNILRGWRFCTSEKSRLFSRPSLLRLADLQVRTSRGFSRHISDEIGLKRRISTLWWLWVASASTKQMQTAKTSTTCVRHALQTTRVPLCNAYTSRPRRRSALARNAGRVGGEKGKWRLNRTGRRMERFIQLCWRSPFHHETDSSALMATVRPAPPHFFVKSGG